MTELLRVWVPGAPGLHDGREAAAEYTELVRAWCREERLPPGSAVRVTVHLPSDATAPNLGRLAAIVEAAADAEVVETTVVSDRRYGVLIERLGESRRPTQLQLALFE
jgi:hypothetical protein